jgi:hypothetical protein
MKWVVSILFVVGTAGALAQGTFQDLDFEEANIVPISGPGNGSAVTVANALPGWTVDYGIVQPTQIYYNSPSLGETAVTLEAQGYPGFFSGTVDGNFSVLLQGGTFDGVLANASISQTGQIPIGTQSLLFELGDRGQVIVPIVSIGSDVLTLFPVGGGTGYVTYGADIAAWAGQTEELTFSGPAENTLLDDISFSPNQITVTPEPSPFLLTGIGGLVFGIYRRIQARRKC